MSVQAKVRAALRSRLSFWYAAMVGVHRAMPEAERQDLRDWEASHLDGAQVGTSDWPGWEKYIGRKP